MKASFAIVGSFADRFTETVDKNINYAHLSWDEVKEMHESGLAEFYSHTYALHSNNSRRGALKDKSESDDEYKAMLAADIDRQNKVFEEHIRVRPIGFTCPFGCSTTPYRL